MALKNLRIVISSVIITSSLTFSLFFYTYSFATDTKILNIESPGYRVSLLELYTSEGCSSCPPADTFMTNLKEYHLTGEKIVPIAFHVTYWDYIGWEDSFASSVYDQRQRNIAHKNFSRSVYTPQFVLNGKDYRGLKNLQKDIKNISSEIPDVDIKLSVYELKDDINLEIKADIKNNKIEAVSIFYVIYENNLKNFVEAGENEDQVLKHDYVVRKMTGPYIIRKPKVNFSIKKKLEIETDWKRKDLGVVVFAQNTYTGKILQALNLNLEKMFVNEEPLIVGPNARLVP